jgi:hypothetical protein
MKKVVFVFTALVLPLLLFAQKEAYQGKAGIADVADTDLGLFYFMMIMLAFIIIAFVATCILALLIVFLIAAMIFFGILSAAVLNGLYHRSLSKGVVLFIKLSMMFIGGGAGFITAFLIGNHIHLNTELMFILIGGSLIGMVGGWLTANLFLKAGRLLLQSVITKTEETTAML